MTAKEGMDAVIHEVDNTTGRICNWISNIYSIPCTQTKDLICVNGGGDTVNVRKAWEKREYGN